MVRDMSEIPVAAAFINAAICAKEETIIHTKKKAAALIEKSAEPREDAEEAIENRKECAERF